MKEDIQNPGVKGTLPPLHIGDLRIDPPIIQGGMGVRISGPRLASAVSDTGALGVLASVGTNGEPPYSKMEYALGAYRSFRDMICETRALTNRPFGVNIMCALTNYDDLVRAADQEKVAAIFSGAGLPLKLPSLVANGATKLIPIVSSGRAAQIICRTWLRKHDRLPDALVVEGPKAGGHLGFSAEALLLPQSQLDGILRDVVVAIQPFEEHQHHAIPVIAAGGVFSGEDIAHMISLGAHGVQIASRLVCTTECDAPYSYKSEYLRCRKQDIIILPSPVGLPLRVIRNQFVDRLMQGDRIPFHCRYKCLRTCDPRQTRYCIAQALVNAYRGNLDAGFATCGAEAYRIDGLLTVGDLLRELVSSAQLAL